jgi:hypothetical protein
MGVVAMGTEQIGSFASSKIPTPFPMDAGFPVVIDITMTFTAQAVALIVSDELPVIESQFILISGIVAVETPPHRFSMMQHDILMSFFQFSPFEVDFHGGMAITARKHPFGKWRRRDWKLL